jgi:hypothetical protein
MALWPRGIYHVKKFAAYIGAVVNIEITLIKRKSGLKGKALTLLLGLPAHTFF